MTSPQDGARPQAHLFQPGDVALLGTGAMGAPMALLLAQHGLTPAVWNRTRSKAEPLTSAGAVLATVPAEAARRVVLTVLDDIDSVRDVVFGDSGLLSGWAARDVPSPTLVVMGTCEPSSVVALGSELAAHGVTVVDAPVSGGPVGAQTGTLSIMVGASPEQFAALSPVFSILGATVRLMGPLGSGQVAKTCNQVIVASTMAAVSEAFALARSAGLDRAGLLEILRGGLASSRILEQRGENWVNESFEPGGVARFHLKDFRSARAIAAAGDLALTVTPAVEDLYQALTDAGDGNLDHSGVFVEVVRRHA